MVPKRAVRPQRAAPEVGLLLTLSWLLLRRTKDVKRLQIVKRLRSLLFSAISAGRSSGDKLGWRTSALIAGCFCGVVFAKWRFNISSVIVAFVTSSVVLVAAAPDQGIRIPK